MCFSNVLYTFHWIWVILTSKFKTDLTQGNFTTKIFWKCSINSQVFFSFLYHFNKKVQNNTFKLHNRRNIHKSIRTRRSHEDLLIERKNMAKKHKMTNTKWHSLACWKKMNIEIKIPTLAWVLTFQKAPQLLQNHELYFNPSSQTKFEHIWVSESCPGSGLDIPKTQTKLCKRTKENNTYKTSMNARLEHEIRNLNSPPMNKKNCRYYSNATTWDNKHCGQQIKPAAILSYWPFWKSTDSV